MIPGSANPLLLATAAAGGYTISRSVRLNASDSAYLSRTPASAGNRRTWTWAGWVKRSGLPAGILSVFESGDNNTVNTLFGFDSDKINLSGFNGAYVFRVQTTSVLRDPSAWYHIVCACDTTQATDTNRVKIYVNGVQQTLTSLNGYPSQNYDTYINSTSYAHQLGGRSNGVYAFPGLLADLHFCDGTAYDASAFGEFSATTGVWMPKAFSGSYGSQGWKLDFADNSAATAAALGKDTSGNGNNWTPTNLSVTAGAGNDSLIDVPVNGSQTDTGVGGEVRGNYCTLNPLIPFSGTLSNGNLDAVTPVSNSTNSFVYGTVCIPTSGKWYWEYVPTANGWQSYCGIGEIGNASSKSVIYYANSGQKYVDGSASAYGATYGDNDVIGVAVDAGAGLVTFYKNNSSQGAISYSVASGIYSAVLGDGTNSLGVSLSINFGQRPFAYTAPSGFKALCTANLPAPTIVKPSTVMDVKLYTGNGTSQTISGLGFSPDMVWFKGRNTSLEWHVLSDTVRGADRQLFPNRTNIEQTNNTYVTSFTGDGFSLGSNTGDGGNNINSTTYAAWAWDAGSSTVTNTAGTITGGAQVRANASAGFSVATYTGTGVNATVGHGLGVAPNMVIVRSRSAGGTGNWTVYHTALGASKAVYLNSNLPEQTDTTNWNSTAPTSTVFSVGTNTNTNGNTITYVAYSFTSVAGYSAFGSYTGNGSTDGPFVFCNFRPRWIMIKNFGVGSSRNWFIYDTSRNPYNLSQTSLSPNLIDAELVDSVFSLDILSNGFKIRTTTSSLNDGVGHLYAAFAESPFQYSRAR